MLLSDNFFMNAKILDSTQFYKFDFHKKVVTQKNLPLQAFATSTLRNSIERRALVGYQLKGVNPISTLTYKISRSFMHCV